MSIRNRPARPKLPNLISSFDVLIDRWMKRHYGSHRWQAVTRREGRADMASAQHSGSPSCSCFGATGRCNPGLNARAELKLIPVTARGVLSGLEQTNIAIYDSASPSLVQITNLAQQRSDWFSLNLQEVPAGIGSGFVWDRNGHIVTNYHVVDGANAAQVTLSDHSTYRATQIWAYEDQDIAVLAIDAPASKLHPIQLGTSARSQSGAGCLRAWRSIRPRSNDDQWHCQCTGPYVRVSKWAPRSQV